jgi:hypothetical protein
MPEDKNAKTVDIDTSGPEVDVELEDTTKPEPEFEVKEETVREVKEEPKASDLKQEASDKKQETGDREDVKKDELEDYSESVQRRIAKLTKKMREAERQKEEALRYAEVLKYEKDVTLKKYSVLEDVSVKDREARIMSGLQAAHARLAASREAQDLNAEVDAQREIARLGYEEARLMDVKSQLDATPKYQTPRPEINLGRSNEQTFRPDSKAENWGSKNKWFGQDAVMTYTAFDIHKKLVDEEGYDASSDEYYAEIDKRIRLELPHKFDKIATTESTKPVQTVASAKRSTKSGRKTVRLTPSQVAIAKKLGVPLEEYAKQLNITKEV